MFTALSTAIASILANRGVRAAATASPYVVALTPLVVFLVAFLVGYLHGDATSRVALTVVAIDEAIIGVGAFIALPKLVPPAN